MLASRPVAQSGAVSTLSLRGRLTGAEYVPCFGRRSRCSCQTHTFLARFLYAWALEGARSWRDQVSTFSLQDVVLLWYPWDIEEGS